MNQVILIGRLVKECELRKTQDDKSVASFTLAVNKPYKNANGSYDADFINCILWNNQADNLHKYTKKGSQIALTGRLNTRSYEDKKGNKVYVTEVVVERVQFLDSKTKEEDKRTNSEIIRNTIASDPFADFAAETIINDDDLPF